MADAAGARILVIDDEVQIRRFLAISLRAQGYEVAEAADGRSGLEALATRGADLVVLDLGLPDLDGLDVLRDLRGWSSVPVIVLSVRASEDQKVAVLDAGANDYVTKPFGVQELSARMRGLLRLKPDGDRTPVFDDGHLRIDQSLRQVWVEGEPVVLSRKEWALLSLLLRHAGRVVTQPQLMRELWGPSHVEDTHYLRVLVAKLRSKLGENAAAPRYLHTEPGVGLRFVKA
jgi:two-component system KDP operon response regulator KdpE